MLDLDFTLAHLTTVPDDLDSNRFATIAHFVLERHAAEGEWTVAVALVSDSHLQQLHRDFMGIDEPTDVMTFPLSEGDDERGGDIAISVDHALIRGVEWAHSPVDEIEFLMIHGLLHLLGWQDGDDTQRLAMLQRQQEIVQEFHAVQ